MPDVEAPEIELDEDAPQFRRRLALVVVLITLFGAVVAYLHEQNSNLEDNAAREAQIQAIKGFGQQVDSSTEAQFNVQLFIQQKLLEQRQRVALARKGATDSDVSVLYGEDAQRWGSLADSIKQGAVIQDDDSVLTNFADLDVAPDKARMTQQVFANKANDYGNKADSYVALLTVLAVGLFLIGLSLTVSGRGRYLLAIPGVAIAVLCVVWSVFITTGSITKISPRAIELAASGQQKQASEPPDLKGAIEDFKAAISDSREFGPAYARLSDAEFRNGVTTSTGNDFESISSPDATRRAIDNGEKAISLGESNPSLLSTVGFFHFTLGEYDRAEALSKQALEGNSEIEPLIFNLGVVQAAKNEKSAARKTYERGIDILHKEQNTFFQSQVISAALTDLDIAETTATSAKDLIQEMKGTLVAAEFPSETDGTDASADDVTIGVNSFNQLTASYTTTNVDDGSDLTNVWYYRPLGASDKGPFSQALFLDSTSQVADGAVSTAPADNGDCLPGGDYRVDVYAGGTLIGTNKDDPFHVPASAIGELELQGGESDQLSLCRPTTWKDQSESEPGTLFAQNPDDPSQTISVFSFPFDSSTLPINELVDVAVSSVVEQDSLTGAGAPQTMQMLGRTKDGRDVPLDAQTVVGTTPDGQRERIVVSVSDDRIVRVAALTAANDTDLDAIGAELISSLRFLDVPEPAA